MYITTDGYNVGSSLEWSQVENILISDVIEIPEWCIASLLTVMLRRLIIAELIDQILLYKLSVLFLYSNLNEFSI